jgi:hypothetical protein
MLQVNVLFIWRFSVLFIWRFSDSVYATMPQEVRNCGRLPVVQCCS